MRFHISFNWKFIKKFIIPLGLLLAIFLGFNTMKVNAAAITQPLYGISNIQSNYGNFYNQTFLSSSGSFPLPIQADIGNSSQFSLRSISMSSYIPISKVGISWSSDLTFVFTIQNGYFTSASCNGITGSVVPEQGVKISLNSITTSCSVSSSGDTLTVKVSTVGTLQNSVNMTSLAFTISNLDNYLYSCDNGSGSMVQACSSNLRINGQSADVNFTITEDPNTAILGGIQQEQQKTNDKLDDLKEQEKETYDYLTDDTPPDSDISSLGNVQGLLPPGPVDSLLNIPFQFLSVINSSFGGVCVPYTGDFVFDSTLTLPCFSEMFYDEVPPLLLNFLSLIPASFILMQYFKHLYKKVNRAVSMETTADDEWGVL